MKTFSRCLPPLVAALAAPGAQAVGLGELHAASQLGTPLRAWVELHAAPSDNPLDWRVDILPDYFAEQGTAPAAVLEGLRARIALSPAGRPYIAIESTAPVDYATLAFRLRISNDHEALTGRFNVRLPETAPPAPLVKKASPATPKARASRQAPPPVAGGETYGPVPAGESLWHVARTLAGSGNINVMMQQLFALNPEAFVRRDITRLRSGSVLKIPAGAAGSAAVTAASAPAAAVAPATPRAAEPGPRGLAALDPALNARLKALDAKFAAIRARYGAPAASVTASVALTPDTASAPASGTVQDAPAPLGSPAVPVEIAQGAASNLPAAPPPPAAPAATLVTPAAPPPPAAAPAVVTPAPVAPAAAPATAAKRLLEPAPSEDATADTGDGILGGGLAPYLLLGACSLAAAGVLAGRRLLARRAASKLGHHDPATDETLKAEVARKTGNRVRLESEIRALVEPTGAVGARPESLAALPPLPLSASSADTAAIDANIAQGLYTEAEGMLRSVIEEKPRNVQAKLRLAEVLYISDQPEAFSELAEELMMSHRQEVTDEDWQRLVRMGKMIAPDFALFSGPRPVGLRA